MSLSKTTLYLTILPIVPLIDKILLLSILLKHFVNREFHSGFKIAEVDLKLRGPGDLMGTQQSGILNLRIADIVQDSDLLYKARMAAKKIVYAEKGHKDPMYQTTWSSFRQIMKNKSIWSNIS